MSQTMHLSPHTPVQQKRKGNHTQTPQTPPGDGEVLQDGGAGGIA